MAVDLDALARPIQFKSFMAEHRVVQGDTLGKLAAHYLGAAQLYPLIFDANQDQLDSPDKIYVGQTLKIPDLPPAEALPASLHPFIPVQAPGG